VAIIFLALMTLESWELAGLVLPLVVILVAQVGMIALVCFWPLFQFLIDIILGAEFFNSFLESSS